MIGGFPKVFEIGKVFRNEGVDPQHNPEFTICEFYQAFANYKQLMQMTQELFRYIVKSIHGSLKVEVSAILLFHFPSHHAC